MIYLSSFSLSKERMKNPNVYPYNVFRDKDIEPLVFSPITVLYGNNGSGKSTLLNIVANRIGIAGREFCNPDSDYVRRFIDQCDFSLGENEEGYPFRQLPVNSRYIKSEDVLYEIKKVQQESVLEQGYVYEEMRKGRPRAQAEAALHQQIGLDSRLSIMIFAQEKYSNGETALQFMDDYLMPDSLYLLDEPEVSLSPANQVALAEEINKMTRFLGCQFIVATHSPFMLATLEGKIYNLDSDDYRVARWSELDNVRYFYDFFKQREDEFTDR